MFSDHVNYLADEYMAEEEEWMAQTDWKPDRKDSAIGIVALVSFAFAIAYLVRYAFIPFVIQLYTHYIGATP